MNTKEKFFKELNKLKSKTNLSKAKGKMHKIDLSKTNDLTTLALDLGRHLDFLATDFEDRLIDISRDVVKEYDKAVDLYIEIEPLLEEVEEALSTLGIEDDSVNYAREALIRWDEKVGMSIDFFYDKLKGK